MLCGTSYHAQQGLRDSAQAASAERWGLMRLVRDMRVIEQGMGDDHKRVFDSEPPILSRLRRVC
jgi:hypothetical protein